jgi:hypothetical protein
LSIRCTAPREQGCQIFPSTKNRNMKNAPNCYKYQNGLSNT